MNEENFASPRKTDGASSIETRPNSSVKKAKTVKKQNKIKTPNKLTVKPKKTPIEKRLAKNKKHKERNAIEREIKRALRAKQPPVGLIKKC